MRFCEDNASDVFRICTWKKQWRFSLLEYVLDIILVMTQLRLSKLHSKGVQKALS